MLKKFMCFWKTRISDRKVWLRVFVFLREPHMDSQSILYRFFLKFFIKNLGNFIWMSENG